MNTTIRLLQRIIKNGRSSIPIFLLLGGGGFAMVPVEFYGLFLSRRLIDEGFLLQNWDTIKDILLVLIILFIIRSLIAYGIPLLSTIVQLRINQKFQNELFSHLLHQPMRFFTREPTGQLMSRVLDDATRFSSILNRIFGPALVDPLKLISLFSLLTYINVYLSFLMAVSTFLSFVVIRWVGTKLRFFSKEIQTKNANIYTFVEQMVSNIELIKSKATETQTATNFRNLIGELIQLTLRMLKISLIAQPVLQILGYLTIGAVFIYGSWMISRNLLSIGTLTIFLGATYLFFNTVNSVGKAYGLLREDLARMEIIFSILDSPPERSGKKSDDEMPPCLSPIEFKNIFFSYNPPTSVLKNVSFHVLRGESLGITGQSGSGKTTLVRLLARFYEPESGEIRLNGQSLHQFDLDALRSAIGIVFQENLILNDTIKNNIAYGIRDVSREQIIKATEISQAHDFIKSLPNQYETVVGEGGKSLSGGERQRLAIARAIISDPEILILDEGTSYLELEQEEAILKQIKETRKDKITIIISHRLSAINIADRIAILDNGKIIEVNIDL